MSRRYLFGPVTAAFAEQNLLRQCQAGQCLAFNANGTTDLTIPPTDTWEVISQRLPSGWQPDFVALAATSRLEGDPAAIRRNIREPVLE